MSRAKTKNDLINDYQNQYAKLIKLINTFSIEEQNGIFGFEDRDKNIRDVLVHLYEWQNMMIRWYSEGCIQKIKPIIPREGYTWKTTGNMNLMIWEMYQHYPLEKAKDSLEETHLKICKIINNLSEEELYIKSHFKWTGTTTLGQYFVSAGPSHYDWAIKKISKYKKEIHK